MKPFYLIALTALLLISCKKTENEFSSDISEISLPSKVKVDQVKFVRPVILNSIEQKVKIEQKIIKEGNLRFETKDLKSTYAKIVLHSNKNQGFIQNDIEGNDDFSVFRKITIRIPSNNFDVFIDSISKGISYFDNKEITAQDVTAEYIDVIARLNAKKTLENRYLELLKKATKVTEMLEIETQLSIIREEVEAKQAELKYLSNRVALSTITIEFYKTEAKKNGATVAFSSKIVNALSTGFNSLSGLFIWLLSVWPFAILISISLYFIRKKFKTK
jgi:hypothetical protein